MSKGLRRLVALLLTVVMVSSLVVVPGYAAEEKAKIVAKNAVWDGNKCTVQVVSEGTEAFDLVSGDYRISFDKDLLTLESVTGGTFSGGMRMTPASANAIERANENGSLGAAFSDATLENNTIGNGQVFATYVFTMKDGVEAEDTKISVSDILFSYQGDIEGVDYEAGVIVPGADLETHVPGVAPVLKTVTFDKASVEVNGGTEKITVTPTVIAGKKDITIKNTALNWVSDPVSEDLEFAADGTIKVSPVAKAATYEITATPKDTEICSGSVKATLTVTRATPVATTVVIKRQAGDTQVDVTDPEVLVKPVTGSEITTYVASVLDQFGDPVSDVAVTWSNGTLPAGVSVTGGAVTVSSDAAKETVDLTATYGTISKTVHISITDVVVEFPEVTLDSVTYGTDNKTAGAKLLANGTTGKASAGATQLVGTFEIVEPDAIQKIAASNAITLKFTVTTEGDYKGVEVENQYPITITPRAVAFDTSNFTITREYESGTTGFTAADVAKDSTLVITNKVTRGEGESAVVDEVNADFSAITIESASGKTIENYGKYAVKVSGVTLTGADEANYKVVEFTINDAEITKILPKPEHVTGYDKEFASVTYTGKAQPVTGVDKVTTESQLGEMTVKYKPTGAGKDVAFVEPINAGVYDVYASFADGGSYGPTDLKLPHTYEITKADRNLTVNGEAENAAMTLTPDAVTAEVTLGYVDEDKSAVVDYAKTSGDATAVTIVGNSFTATGNGVVTVTVAIAETDNYNAATPVVLTVTAIKDAVVGMSITPKNANDKLTSKLDGKTIRIVGTAASSTDVPEVTLTLDKNLPDAWKAEQTGSTVKVMNGDVEFESYSIDMSGVVVLPEGVTITTEVTGDATVDEKEIEAAVISSIASVLNLKAGDTVKVTVAVTKAAAGNSATVRVGYTVTPTGGTAGESVTFTGTLKAPITITLPVDNAYAFAKVDDSHYFPVTLSSDGKTATWKQDVFTETGTVTFVEKQAVTIIYTKADGTKETVVHDFSNLIMPTDNTGRGRFLGWTVFGEDGKEIQSSMRELTVKFVGDHNGEELTATSAFRSTSTGGSSSGSSSSSSASGRNAITVRSSRNGSVKLSDTRAKEGDTVTITVTPRDGYVVDEVTVTDRNGNNVRVRSGKDDETFTFTMPETAVTVEATFVVDDGSGSNEPGSSNPFYDVNADAYYYAAVLWAVEQGVTAGTTDSTFSPNNACTRAQTVTFLWRAAGSPAPSSTLNPFTDVVPGSYYYDAVLWAVEQGITTGLTATTFGPNATVNRGQVVTFLYRSAKAEPVDAANPFSDVPQDAYYTSAVLWAVTNGITNGTTDTTFAPGNACTRAQIVTFLYRHFA